MANRRRAITFIAAVSALAIGATSCTSGGGQGGGLGLGGGNPLEPPAPPAPKTITVQISASGDINPGPTGKAAPLPMQVYVLRSTGRFQSLDYFELKNSGASALSGDVVDSSTVSVRPGETKSITLSGGVDGAYVGVAAGFREIDSARWRAQAGIGESTSFAIQASRSSVSVAAR